MVPNEEIKITPVFGIAGILTGSMVLIDWSFPRAPGMLVLGAMILITDRKQIRVFRISISRYSMHAVQASILRYVIYAKVANWLKEPAQRL